MNVVGAYVIEGEVARGGSGVVYRARAADGTPVALKLLDRATTEEALARFDRERRLIASVGDGFVPLLDAGRSPRGPWIAMPFLTGGTLRQRLAGGAFTIERTLALGAALAGSLARAHALGVVHRDLKPENVLFDAAERPLIADLGIAKHFRRDVAGGQHSRSLSTPDELRGTAGYAPAEQQRDARSVGPSADVFALGVILYECLAGVAPFADRSFVAVLQRVEEGRFTPLRSVRPEVPGWLADVIEKALARDPAGRHRDAGELAAALAGGPPRRRARLAWIVAPVLAAGTGLALVAGRKAPPPEAPVVGARPAPVASDAPPGAPAWWAALPATARPRLPLPRGVRFGERPGEYVHEADGSVLVFVPGGAAWMGRDDGPEREGPRHQVELSPYFFGKHEVTRAQFERFVAARSYVTDAERGATREESAHDFQAYYEDATKPGRSERTRPKAGLYAPGRSFRSPSHVEGRGDPGQQPVVCVTPRDVAAYLRWAGARLPSEAEWERAATGGRRDVVPFPWGAAAPGRDARKLANLADEALRALFPDASWAPEQLFTGYDDGFPGTAPVGSFPEDAGPEGALDVLGNVRELCADHYVPDAYSTREALRRDPLVKILGAIEAPLVVRGSGWLSPPKHGRLTMRSDFEFPDCDVGFRIACPAR